MTRTHRRAAALLLLAAATALPGCYFARTCIPMDAKGMDVPFDWAAANYREQVNRTSARLENLPEDFSRGVKTDWRNLTTYPGE